MNLYIYELSINNKNGDFMTFLLVFIFKIVENTINTLRIIVISNNKKILGAILLGVTSLIWIITTSIVIMRNNILEIIFFVLGSIIGSYLGSFIEEKIALGNCLITVITDNNYTDDITKKISNKMSIINNKNEDVLMIISSRKERSSLVEIIKKINDKAIIMSERIYRING